MRYTQVCHQWSITDNVLLSLHVVLLLPRQGTYTVHDVEVNYPCQGPQGPQGPQGSYVLHSALAWIHLHVM